MSSGVRDDEARKGDKTRNRNEYVCVLVQKLHSGHWGIGPPRGPDLYASQTQDKRSLWNWKRLNC